MTFRAELYRDRAGHEVWQILDDAGRVYQAGIASDLDLEATLAELAELEHDLDPARYPEALFADLEREELELLRLIAGFTPAPATVH